MTQRVARYWFFCPPFSYSPLFLSFSFLPYSAELLNCPFSKAPQPQNLSRGNPQGHRRIRDGEREKKRDERSPSLNQLEENIVTLISPLLILTPNVGAIHWQYHVLGGCGTHSSYRDRWPWKMGGIQHTNCNMSWLDLVEMDAILKWWELFLWGVPPW